MSSASNASDQSLPPMLPGLRVLDLRQYLRHGWEVAAPVAAALKLGMEETVTPDCWAMAHQMDEWFTELLVTYLKQFETEKPPRAKMAHPEALQYHLEQRDYAVEAARQELYGRLSLSQSG